MLGSDQTLMHPPISIHMCLTAFLGYSCSLFLLFTMYMIRVNIRKITKNRQKCLHKLMELKIYTEQLT
jgi:hypothetical protein